MASETKLPFMNAYGTIAKTLEKVKAAATPARFTQDFLSTKLGMKGGSAKPVIPFLKRTGFLGTDGVPTDLYKRFRNPAQEGPAAAAAIRHGYGPLYEMNEYVHDLKDSELKGLVVQATGLEPGSSTVKAIVGSFKALRTFATFDIQDEDDDENQQLQDTAPALPDAKPSPQGSRQLNLGYTINLHLPPTSDVAVFNAIFKSLKEHLL